MICQISSLIRTEPASSDLWSTSGPYWPVHTYTQILQSRIHEHITKYKYTHTFTNLRCTKATFWGGAIIRYPASTKFQHCNEKKTFPSTLLLSPSGRFGSYPGVAGSYVPSSHLTHRHRPRVPREGCKASRPEGTVFKSSTRKRCSQTKCWQETPHWPSKLATSWTLRPTAFDLQPRKDKTRATKFLRELSTIKADELCEQKVKKLFFHSQNLWRAKIWEKRVKIRGFFFSVSKAWT